MYYDDNHCQIYDLPIGSMEWSEDLSGIGDDFTNPVIFQDNDELCCCTAKDDHD